MSIFIVLPTFNERENLGTLLPKIYSIVPSAHVLVVDDNSPDGTADFVESYQKENANSSVLHLLRREKKEGLGKAYLAGFEYALGKGAEKIIEMDADHSHDPEELPRLLSLSNQFDLVVGSRYVAGGCTVGWLWYRRLLSRSANFYARTILRLPVHDVTTGYRCFHRRVLERIDLNKIQSIGYGFQVELVYKAYQEGFSIVESPIVFKDRQYGKSKMGIHVALEGAVNVWKMRRYQPERASDFQPIFYSPGEKP